MGLRHQLRRLRERAGKGAVVLEQRDGTRRYFEDMECFSEMFLAQTSLFKGEARDSEVLRAVRNATPESRQKFEAKYGPIEKRGRIICPVVDGGWVEVFELLEDGTVRRTFHEGDSEEAARIRQEARQRTALDAP